ncbi:Hypothetical Protein FCC1311_072022 [Hondaea fermentalgiana]|uniref:DUF1501 domain-containing protein n=1 Tax=Hondaea fermentalgiana TaxID=2315210 RepID=A0A2R5GRL0_9STRA|nr:Hypothetical Protein FCC1311_072022 [Hondaea fermentalgiana]|eukprot:GBG30981.1 Hypothetical Protein FCC1311_072022 [Hondaea fermentalgiana]
MAARRGLAAWLVLASVLAILYGANGDAENALHHAGIRGGLADAESAAGNTERKLIGLFADEGATKYNVKKKRDVNLARAGNQEVLLLIDEKGAPQARSYAGNDWELLQAKEVSCSSNKCTVSVSDQAKQLGSVALLSFQVTGDSSSIKENARFLLQSTFGPTRSELNAMGSSGSRFKSWIEDQAALEPTLHRAYYRERMNQPISIAGNVGRPRQPCEAMSRWHKYALSSEDVGKILTKVDRDGFYELRVDDIVRHHETKLATWKAGTAVASWPICSVGDSEGGVIKFGVNCNEKLNNPIIKFLEEPEPFRIVHVSDNAMSSLTPSVSDVKILTDVPSDCSLPVGGTVFAITTSGDVYKHTARLVTVDNPIEAPASGMLLESTCPNVPRTFLNVDSCITSSSACVPTRFTDAYFELSEESLRKFYRLGNKYVYYVDGLTVDAAKTPCSAISRWTFSKGSCGAAATYLDNRTKESLIPLLEASFENDGNPHVRDIPRIRGKCNKGLAKAAKVDVKYKSKTYCFEHVHPELYNVYDFSYWSILGAHPGNAIALENGRANPIKKIAQSGETKLSFPSWHPYSRWKKYSKGFSLLGRLDDTVNFRELPSTVQSVELGKEFGADVPVGDPNSVESIAMSCGSPGEVASNPLKGSRFGVQILNEEDADPEPGRFDEPVPKELVQSAVWTNVALTAPDQLRQRVAWALSQIYVVSATMTMGTAATEMYLAFYDIFVRQAFGNFHDLLREISYSPLMATMLSFVGSKSTPYTLERYRRYEYPDENYAREVMQLFSIGLVKLNPDGTPVLDSDGEPVPTYDNDEIMEFARAWTGFDLQVARGNTENFNEGNGNYIDPMKLIGEYRDPFPKLGLDGAYVGDGYPLCSNLPTSAFLSEGAEYRFIGAYPLPELQDEPTQNEVGEEALRVELDPETSELFDVLCNGPNTKTTDLAKCTFKPQVRLDKALACKGKECKVDDVRIVMLPQSARRCPDGQKLETYHNKATKGDLCRDTYNKKTWTCPTGCSVGTDSYKKYMCVNSTVPTQACRIYPEEHKGIFYEYVRPACTQLSFFNDGKRISAHNLRGAMCADPKSIAAAPACCKVGDRKAAATQRCEYGAERVSYATAKKRCATQWSPAQETCNFKKVGTKCPTVADYIWSDAACPLQVKISDSGKIAIVHDVAANAAHKNINKYRKSRLDPDTQNWFRAVWTKPFFPNCPSACTRVEASSEETEAGCLCPTEVKTSAVFSSMPTREEVIENLRIGSGAPQLLSDDFKEGETKNGVTAWHKKSGKAFSDETVFEVEVVSGTTRYFVNMESIVHIPGTSASFRNPPTFHDVAEIKTRDAMHETEAVIEQYVTHPNAAPFIARQLIQHLVTSNPSPRYVGAVADAFRSGKYDGVGTGKFGDMKATVAAVLLDREARSSVIDADPTYGQHRESLTKVIHFMRSMEIKPKRALVVLQELLLATGMEPHDAPTVFSFYQPGYSPSGVLRNASLVAPQAQVLSPPLVMRFLNSLYSLVTRGLTDCSDGIGLPPDSSNGCSAHATLEFTPTDKSKAGAAAVVDEMDNLLTGGRLGAQERAIIEEEYTVQRKNGLDRGVRFAQQLFLGTPQFHTLGRTTYASKQRVVTKLPSGDNGSKPYKAVVFVDLSGGADSYNFLVPLSGCANVDLYDQYARIRGSLLAHSKSSLLEISANSPQACSKFGLHPSMTALRSLYNAGDVNFLANTGVLVEPLHTKGNGKRPRGLYSHNTQERSVQTSLPQYTDGTGVLGRMMDELTVAGYNTNAASISGNVNVLEGTYGVSPRPDIINERGGVSKLASSSPKSSRLHPALQQLNRANTNLFAEAWAETFEYVMNRTEELDEALGGGSLSQSFPNSGLSKQFAQVARLIKAGKKLGVNRGAFYTKIGSFDTHSNAKTRMEKHVENIDTAVEVFAKEMKAQGMWDQVVIVFTSEFGRTLTSNGAGTDHGWGGNYFMAGGGLKSGKILGEYPYDLTAKPINQGRGRMMPTTGWDSVWNAVAQWMGVTGNANLNKVLPNRENFGDSLFEAKDVFK